jgi:hypothetical protein
VRSALIPLLGFVLWEKLAYHDLYVRPVSTHWFQIMCARAAERLKTEREWTSDPSLTTMRDSTGNFRLPSPPYRLTYECWPDTIDPRRPK